ncbi:MULTISPECIES: hypothetical protein [Micrococcaceae]|uniref:hypothetical protein n=1 Tax=Micrococcaceae TaxID=1268 RepID=UPI0004857E38|nr:MULTISPECIES: hypothetical protein [Micrococcaceae]MDE8671031.1 hypothetical protein [Pseudarthrobacter sp. H3Y2-7]
MTEKPDLGNRRTKMLIKPAPDEHVDPIETPQVAAPAPASERSVPAAAKKPAAAAAPRDLNLQVSDEVFETIDFTKFKTKLTKRAIVEQAVLAHWAKYRQQ